MRNGHYYVILHFIVYGCVSVTSTGVTLPVALMGHVGIIRRRFGHSFGYGFGLCNCCLNPPELEKPEKRLPLVAARRMVVIHLYLYIYFSQNAVEKYDYGGDVIVKVFIR